jgi:hypothetical protein
MCNKVGQSLNQLILAAIEAKKVPPKPKIIRMSLQDIPAQKTPTEKDQYITFSRSIDHFYVFSTKHVSTIQVRVEEICDRMLKERGETVGENNVEDRPTVGDLVYGLYEEDGAWYRCLVTNCNEERTNYELFYIDFGNTEIATAQNVLVGVDADQMSVFNEYAPQAFKCKLFGVQVPHEQQQNGGQAPGVFSDAQNKAFKKFIGNKMFSVRFLECDEKEGVHGVSLDEVVPETLEELFASVHIYLLKEKLGNFSDFGMTHP